MQLCNLYSEYDQVQIVVQIHVCSESSVDMHRQPTTSDAPSEPQAYTAQ